MKLIVLQTTMVITIRLFFTIFNQLGGIMFTKLIPILLLPALIFSASTVTTEITFAKPVVTNNMVYVQGCKTMVMPFAPSIPTKTVSLKLPIGEVAESFDVEYGEPIAIEGTHYINAFLPGGRVHVAPKAEYYTRKSSVYSTDALFPAEIKSPRFFTQHRYGHPIFTATIRPVQYNPVTGKLQYVKSVTVKVKTKQQTKELPVVKFSPFIKSQLALEIDNPESLQGIPYTKAGPNDYEYAIITTEALKNSWGDFVEFNKRRGLRSKIETIQNINSNFPGQGAEKLKAYLKQEYKDNNITYVMLGGDDKITTNNQVLSDAIPHKGYSAAFKDYGTDPISDRDIAADMFYETLDGEELKDLEWELYAARFPADNNTELQRMISKTISYSEKPVNSSIKKCIISGEYKWKNINGGSCYGKDQMVYLYGKTSKNGYTTTGFPSSWTKKLLYEKDRNWSKADMINAINSGQNIVFHTGHSNNFMIMKLSMSQNDVARLNNTSYYIGYTTGCYPGSWDNRKISFNASFTTGHYADDCINEEFMCGTSKGSVAFVSNTRFGLGDNGRASHDGTDGSTIRFMRYFLNAIFDEKMHHIAVMHAYSKWINKEAILVTDVNKEPYFGQMAYCAYELNVLGDPALSIWTETPQTLTPDHPTSIADGNFSWDSKKPYCWVALLDKDGKDIVCAQQSGKDGKITISNDAQLAAYVTANPTGKMKINVKAHNFLPYQGEVKIDASAITNKKIAELKSSIALSKTRISFKLPGDEHAQVSLYNAKGVQVLTKAFQGQAGMVSLSGLSNGIYHLHIESKSVQFTDKFVLAN